MPLTLRAIPLLFVLLTSFRPAAKAYGFSPAVIHPASRACWDSLTSQIRHRRKMVQRRIGEIKDSVQTDIRMRLSREELDRLSRELLFWENGMWRLDSTLRRLRQLEKSGIVYSVVIRRSSAPLGLGYTAYDSASGGIVLTVGSTANFVHEATHGFQFLRGQIAFRKDSDYFADNEQIEIEAYQMQFAFDPYSFSGLSAKDPTTYTMINGEWLKKLEIGGCQPYADGRGANRNLAPNQAISPTPISIADSSILKVGVWTPAVMPFAAFITPRR
jgi:hypothetical protein